MDRKGESSYMTKPGKREAGPKQTVDLTSCSLSLSEGSGASRVPVVCIIVCGGISVIDCPQEEQ